MKVTTARDVWMSILERYFLNPVFWKRGKRRPTLFCVKRRGCDVPEDIIVDWSLRYLRSAPATSRKQFSVWTILLCIAIEVYVCVLECTCYIGANSQIPRGRPSLLYDHINVILRVVV